MINKLILAIFVLMLSLSLSIASDTESINEPGTGPAKAEINETAQEIGPGSQNINDSLFLGLQPCQQSLQRDALCHWAGTKKRVYQLLCKPDGGLDSFPGEV